MELMEHLAPPNELGIHTRDDLRAYDRFLEFVLGNGEMRARIDALHSQHLNGANKRAAPSIHIVDAWGDPVFPYFRSRPAGLFVSRLVREDEPAVGLTDLVDYRQSLELRTATLATRYAWKRNGASGESRAEGFLSHANRHLMAHRYEDQVDRAGFFREFAVKTRFPYHTRSIEGRRELRNCRPPQDGRIEIQEGAGLASIRFSLRSTVWQTEIVWAIGGLGARPQWQVLEEEGGVLMRWPLVPGERHSVPVICVILTDRDGRDPGREAIAQLGQAREMGYDDLRLGHVEAWRREWEASSLQLPDPYFQRLWEVSRYHLLCNVGGSYWGNIAVDEYAWDTHMLDSMIAAHALLETGNVELVKKHLSRLGGRYLRDARENAQQRLERLVGPGQAEAALLPGFLSEDGQAHPYEGNHFWVHGPQIGAHALALCKAAGYTADPRFLREVAYPWIRGFAEYARSIAVRHPQLGYVYPVWLSGTVGELRWESSAGDVGELRAEESGPYGVNSPSHSHLCAVLTGKRVLEIAAALAAGMRQDEDLVPKWLEIADNLHIPQSEERLLGHSHDDGVSGQYLPGPLWGLFWPNEGMFRRFPLERVKATLANCEARRNREIISWNSGFAALAHAYLGDGEAALELAREFFAVCDRRMIQMRDNTGPVAFFAGGYSEHPPEETCPGYVHYYDLSGAVYLLLVRTMLLQDQPGGGLAGFPAVPRCWEEVEFSGFPASDGRRVSGRWSKGKGEIETA